MSLSSTGDSIVLPWKGAPPAEVAQLVAEQPVPVSMLDVKYSAAELLTMAKQVADANPDTVASVGPNAMYDGLEIETASKVIGPGFAEGPAADPGDLPPIVSPVPFQVIGSADVVPTQRDKDASPFWGANLVKNGTSACSGGVSVKVGGVSGMTTAWHCGIGTWKSHGNNKVLGTVSKRNKTHVRRAPAVSRSASRIPAIPAHRPSPTWARRPQFVERPSRASSPVATSR
ncbi:hypothetical protein Aco04nite_35770 [Winogradskya consettensis]|uniref:Uncharacterized protein n=1 Tax=Winogradskya consettensis TaxID=113560 RepID=A0A919VYB4_9ACTN|nr:hypothetical protein Aco04nite_35770 [Actinoplanes consettensis]